MFYSQIMSLRPAIGQSKIGKGSMFLHPFFSLITIKIPQQSALRSGNTGRQRSRRPELHRTSKSIKVQLDAKI
jgi:hypothetical protein